MNGISAQSGVARSRRRSSKPSSSVENFVSRDDQVGRVELELVERVLHRHGRRDAEPRLAQRHLEHPQAASVPVDQEQALLRHERPTESALRIVTNYTNRRQQRNLPSCMVRPNPTEPPRGGRGPSARASVRTHPLPGRPRRPRRRRRRSRPRSRHLAPLADCSIARSPRRSVAAFPALARPARGSRSSSATRRETSRAPHFSPRSARACPPSRSTIAVATGTHGPCRSDGPRPLRPPRSPTPRRSTTTATAPTISSISAPPRAARRSASIAASSRPTSSSRPAASARTTSPASAPA